MMPAKKIYHLCRSKQIMCMALVSLLSLFNISYAFAWQNILNDNFDIAETFDHYQDWNPLQLGYHWHEDKMPVYESGEQGIWSAYYVSRIIFAAEGDVDILSAGDELVFESGATGVIERFYEESERFFIQLNELSGDLSVGDSFEMASSGEGHFSILYIPQYISNHGDYSLDGGKSLRINYNDFSGGFGGFGPTRLGLYFGDGVDPNSGYEKIHIFFRIKFADGFFTWLEEEGRYDYIGTLKLFHLSSGFTDIDYFGDSAEHATLRDSTQTKREYGSNATIFNLSGGGRSAPNQIFLEENTFVAEEKSGGWDKRLLYKRNMSDSGSGDISRIYESKEWVNFEVVVDIGTPGSEDGSVELFIYDQQGEVIGQWGRENENRLQHFDHAYNKILIGGNRICRGYGACPDGLDNRFYIDDIIVDSEMIGERYFELRQRRPQIPTGFIRN